VDIEEVQQLSPARRFLYWITEREAIRLHREEGEGQPWTDDFILNTYRFCNVRRMDDKVSRWLLENWYTPFHGHRNMLKACAIARFFNLPSSLEAITRAVFDTEFIPATIKSVLRYLRDDVGQPIFNGAYMVRGNDGMDKIECVMDYYVARLPLSRDVLRPDSMRETWLRLVPSYGFGSFMAGQLVADLRHAMPGEWADRNTWAPPGPGSIRGLNRFLERDLKTTYTEGEFSIYLAAIIDSCSPLLPPELVSRMEAIDWQNCLCEFDKYERTLWGQGRPKSLYRCQGDE
jgi:hypothetical protein